MQIQLLRFANHFGITLLPYPINKVVESYCKKGNLVHLESGSIVSNKFSALNNMIYIKSYGIGLEESEFNSFLCIPHFNSTNIDFIPVAEFSQNFMTINMSFKKSEQYIIMDLLKQIHGKPAIILSQYNLN
jgi:hypothetical protein